MVSTRAMARKGPDAEESEQLNLRKKPIRRATAKSAAALTAPTSTTKSAAKPTKAIKASKRDAPEPVKFDEKDAPEPVKVKPLSPKKITQITRRRVQEDAMKIPLPPNPERSVRVAAVQLPSEPVLEKKKPALEKKKPFSTGYSRASARSTRPVRSAATEATTKVRATRKRAVKVATPEPEPDKEPEQQQQCEEEQEDDHTADIVVEEEDHTPSEQMVEAEAEAQATCGADEEDLVLASPEQPAASSPAHAAPTPRLERHLEDDDDELCGPVTPMRRGFTPARLRQAQPFESVSRRLQTPARRSVMFSARREIPQTQKLPIRQPASYSPQRPMTVSRGASRPYVFPELTRPAQSQHESPDKSPLKRQGSSEAQMPLQIPEDSNELVEVDDASDHEVLVEHNESESEHDQEPEEDEEEMSRQAENVREDDWIEEEPEADTQQSQNGEIGDTELEMVTMQTTLEGDVEEEAQLDTDSEDELQQASGNEDDEDVLPDQNDPANESDYEQEDDLPSDDDEQSDSESTMDETIIEPQLPADIMQSSPAQPVPTFADETEMDLDISEVASSVPSTPTSVIIRNIEDEDDESIDDEPAPTPHVPLSDDSTLSAFEDGEDATPWKSRVSFNTATARMLQTPNMRAFRREEIMADEPSPSVSYSTETDQVFIDPALLAEQDNAMNLALEADVMAGVITNDHFLDFSAHISTPVRSHLPDTGTPRMSMLEESILIEPADAGFHSSTTSNEQAPTTAERTIEELAVAQDAVSSPQPIQHWDMQEFVNEAITPLPHYAKATVSTSMRRKTMPNFEPSTPRANTPRPMTADTVVKPTSINSFAKFMVSKAGQNLTPKTSTRTPKSQLQATPSMHKSTPSMHKPTPLSTQRKPVPIIQAQPATPISLFTGPKLRKHTPTPIPIPSRPQSSLKTPIKTPIKTPLKAPGVTPGPYPMTPHPFQPLRNITALVEVFTLDGSSASGPFIALLHRLGARTTKQWSERVTHVVFKDGSPTTLQKVRLANKDSATENSKGVFCVNSRWVTDCDREGVRQDEQNEQYAVDTSEIPRGGQRRRKSMEPASLRNLNGNVVATPKLGKGRKETRVSLASTCWGSSPVKGGATPRVFGDADEENWDDTVGDIGMSGSEDEDEERMRGLQMTAPVKKMQKLRLKGEGSRRLTFFPERNGM